MKGHLYKLNIVRALKWTPGGLHASIYPISSPQQPVCPISALVLKHTKKIGNTSKLLNLIWWYAIGKASEPLPISATKCRGSYIAVQHQSLVFVVGVALLLPPSDKKN